MKVHSGRFPLVHRMLDAALQGPGQEAVDVPPPWDERLAEVEVALLGLLMEYPRGHPDYPDMDVVAVFGDGDEEVLREMLATDPALELASRLADAAFEGWEEAA